MAYVEADSFTTVERVRALVARVSAYDATSKPTLQQVLDRMAQQGARVQAVLQKYGHAGTVPSGGAPLTAYADDIGDTLNRLCDEANAFLAAAYVLQMHDVRDTDDDVFNAYIAAAEALIGNEEKGIIGLIATLLQTAPGAVPQGHAVVNTVIETEMVNLLHPVVERW